MNLIRRVYPNPRFDSHWNLWSDFDDIMQGLTRNIEPAALDSFSPTAEFKESDKGYLLSFDMPGLKEEDIKIEFNDSLLRVSGERKSEHKDEKDSYFKTEKYYGRFERQFKVPESVDENAVEAHYKDGVLQVFLPKSPAKIAKKIEVKKGDDSLLKRLFSKSDDQH